jgi:lysozyme family protein
MRTCNKVESFKLVRALNSDGDREALDDATLDRYWRDYRIAELPEPLDAIVLQCFVALPADAAIRLMQSACYHEPINGVLDDDTMARVQKMRSAGVEELLLHEQAGYYVGTAQRELCGFDLGAGLRRIDRCNEFLADWTTAHRNNVPLRAL